MLSTSPLRNSSATIHVVTFVGIHSHYLRNEQFQALWQIFFNDRVVNVWNALPAADVDFTSLARFRHSIFKGRSVGLCQTVLISLFSVSSLFYVFYVYFIFCAVS